MNYRKILIEVAIMFGLWLVEKLFFKVFVNRKIVKRGMVHHTSLWTILLFLLTWWNFGYYYISYPIIVMMVASIILIVIQFHRTKEFLYRRYWPAFWNLNCLILAICFIISTFSFKLPTP